MKGLIVLGASGCGKTSFCFSMQNFVNSTNELPIFVNLDPGNNLSLSSFDINIQELINSYEIIPELNLGPNGSLLYSIEYFEKNNDWFEYKFINLTQKLHCYYFLFDLPGQIELFTHHLSVRKFIKKILSVQINLVSLILTDSFFIKDKSTNNSLFLVSIIIMLNIELPHIHLSSKSDLFENQNITKNFNNLYLIANKDYLKKFSKSCFLWSKRLFYDLTYLITDFSSLNSMLISIYYPKSIQMVHTKIKTIIKS